MDVANIFAFDINGSVFWARGFKKKKKEKNYLWYLLFCGVLWARSLQENKLPSCYLVFGKCALSRML